MTSVMSLMGFNFRILLPVLASKTLAVGPAAFGALYACFGMGALVGALFTAGTAMPRWKVLLVGVGGSGLPMLLLAPLRLVWLVALVLFAIGIGFSFWNAASQAIVQLTAPDRLRGRALSLLLFAWGGLTPVGSLLAGWLASVGGTDLAFSVGGATGLLVTGIVIARTRGQHLMRLQGFPSPLEETIEPPPV